VLEHFYLLVLLDNDLLEDVCMVADAQGLLLLFNNFGQLVLP